MKKYVAILGRQPKISVAELESLYSGVRFLAPNLAEFQADSPDISRLGGTLKIAEHISSLPDFLSHLPQTGKITLGLSDLSRGATPAGAGREALRLKKLIMKRHDGSARVVPNATALLTNAVSLHNGLYKENKIELLRLGKDYFRVLAISDIDAYARRDQKRPARDAKVGMLPPKLAQILINLCGPLPAGARLLDPFCGTGVVLQEAILMGYSPLGSDISERMVEYTKKNLDWLTIREHSGEYSVEVGDATTLLWPGVIDAVACEGYLGPPMSQPPAEIKLREVKQECSRIILGFLRNLSAQITSDTPVVMAIPAWRRPDGRYSRLNLIDEIENLRYNVCSFKNLGQEDLLYYREGQVVAREIIVLRKK